VDWESGVLSTVRTIHQAETKGDVEMELRQRDIESIEYKADELTVTFSVPHEGGTLRYTEVFHWSAEYPPQWFKDATATWFEEVHRAVTERVYEAQEVPCGRCTGACCRNWGGGIRVTDDDVARLESGGIDPRASVDLWDGAQWFPIELGSRLHGITPFKPSIDESIGMMKMVPWKGLDPKKEETACVHLRDTGCSIYEFRPQVCRDYTARGCTMVEEDPRKVKGLIQLGVKR
jgi:Fe-S-cluster containining protein